MLNNAFIPRDIAVAVSKGDIRPHIPRVHLKNGRQRGKVDRAEEGRGRLLRTGCLEGLGRFDVRVQGLTQAFTIDRLSQERGEQILPCGRGLVI